MYARSTTITGSAERVDFGIAYVSDEVMPVITSMTGCAGMSMVVDRDAGQIIATSSWHDQQSMQTHDERLATLRARGAEILGGEPVVQEWEVAVMHRDHATHEGCCCRITWARAEDVERAIEGWRSQILPQIEQLAGFCSASLFVERSSGAVCATVSFDDRDALENTREFASSMRDLATRELGVEIMDIGEFELAMAHLGVPELV